jgi:hypothetical protein
MDLSYITFLLFAAFSSLRMFSYLPQIYSVATDKNGASAISYSTWGLWIGANATTALYALNNLNDVYLASVSMVYAACCVSVIILTVVKRRRHRRGAARSEAAARRPARRQGPNWTGARWGVALAATAAISVGLGARWMLPDVSHLVFATATADQASEIAVADTPFEDEVFPVGAKTAATAAPVREVRPLPLTKMQFEGKLAPKSKRGEGP